MEKLPGGGRQTDRVMTKEPIFEIEDFSLTEEEILHLVQNNKTKNSGKTEAEIMNNIVRDPILIGVTRYFL